MAITVAQLQSDLDAARTAIAAGDYDTALTYCRCALAVLAGLPNSSLGDSSVQWRESVRDLITTCEKGINTASVTAAGGIQRTKIEYVAVTD